MGKDLHSRIVLDQASANTFISWILKRNEQEIFRTLKATHEKDHIHMKISGINYDHISGGVDIPFFGRLHPLQPLVGDSLEGDLFLSLNGRYLQGKIDLHGLGPSLIQNIPGIDSIVFLFAPHLKKIGALRIHGPYDFDFDLSSLKIPDGNKGEMDVTELIEFHSIKVGNTNSEMLIVGFSVK